MKFTRGSWLVALLGVVVLAVGVRTVVDEKAGRYRCRIAPPRAGGAVQEALDTPIPAPLKALPGFADLRIADRHPRLVDARAVLSPVRGFSYVAGYVQLDGGARRGPAVWRVFDPAAGAASRDGGSLDGRLDVSADNAAAHALTPMMGYSPGPPSTAARKALECAREVR